MKWPIQISVKWSGRKRSGKKRAYDAADKGRRAKAFRMATSTGANKELQGALITLRNRSRHMVRNNTWSKRAVEAIAKHTIGEGIQPAPDPKHPEVSKVRELWESWATKKACDWSEATTFYGLQELIMRSVAESGEALVLRKWVEPTLDCPIPLQLQVIEGDHIDSSREGVLEFEVNGELHKGKARFGIQFDERGKLAGYWLFDYHPGEGDSFGKYPDSTFYPKSEVLHIREVLRPGQLRGLPIGVAGFMKSSDFSDYEDAQLVKQKIAACFSAFVLGADEDEGDEESQNEDENLEPGMLRYLSTGQSMEFANPPSTSDYDSYSTRILQGVAAGYGITYEMLTMDYSRVSFTSGRMGKLDVKQNFHSWQYHMTVPQLCDGVWLWFIEAAITAGLLNEYVSATWTAPRVPMLDPLKETTAQVMQIKNGLNTASEVIRENGREPSELFEEYKDDQDQLNKLGIVIESINPKKDNNAEE